ncbi:haloacid dehalogenase-like hydrolase [Pyxidicoccus parkwayensis]|uniref:Haloacid dehalogenase-like hydrolase n=1 Tax=Pyxidicoccus parkwayensis TaxID=2813578 RepID=A0ABX7P4J2_9BACT|nr:HAD family hydrolase [Pyxidicoccus parkwaysis]QSQ25356.1 haloacid dehalogenase-like hydrolase [Pyxidicoccus parkwaysis]
MDPAPLPSSHGDRDLASEARPLRSWNDGAVKQALLAFVDAVTSEGADTCVPPEHRVAIFDNDGTLWTEQPFYSQGLFVFDRIRALAAEHPEWKTQRPFQAVLEAGAGMPHGLSEHDVGALVAATHAGMTTDAFDRISREWLATARHPRFHRRYTECVYQPMLELLALLRARGFTSYIVSGGGIDFLRAFCEEVYAIPPARVVGSSSQVRFELHDGRPVLIKLPELGSIDDGPGKPVNIHLHIGKRPILTFGNSDGDLQMLQYASVSELPHLELLLHHDDAEREYAYDRVSLAGRLDEALREAGPRKWTVVSMKRDWKEVFGRHPATTSPGTSIH